VVLVNVLALTALAAGGVPPAVGETAKASSARCSDRWELHPGAKTVRASCGQRVRNLQWLLAGHKPFALTAIKETFKAKPNGLYGARTASAVKAMKWRAGYPQKGQCKATANMASSTRVGPQFFAILENKQKRSLCWVGLASDRVKGAIRAGSTSTADKVRLLELSQLGVHENPARSNRGPCISYTCTLTGRSYGPYQGATGAYGLAWCASFGDWALKSVRGRGFGSTNDAYVPAIAIYARDHGWLAAKPKVGSFVVFLNSSYTLDLNTAYHIGYVVKVTASGVQTIEGNATDTYGGGVREVWRAFASWRMVYVDLPGVA
jgi:hypothetical protein